MSVLHQLASALGRRDEAPNQELAARMAESKDKAAVKELVDNLENKSKDIRHDCIKTLYETGYLEPGLIADYAPAFVKQLDSKFPRMVWGAMTALSALAPVNTTAVYEALPKIIEKADNSGSVIARDHAMYILAAIGTRKEYYEDAFALIAQQLLKAPVNQFPMYCEITAPVIQPKDKPAYKSLLENRLQNIDLEAKRKRILRVLKSF